MTFFGWGGKNKYRQVFKVTIFANNEFTQKNYFQKIFNSFYHKESS